MKVGDIIISKLNPSTPAVRLAMDFGDGSIGIEFISGSSKGRTAIFQKKNWELAAILK